MKEFQFKLPGFWVDVHAETTEEAVKMANSQLHLLDEPLPAPGRFTRVTLDVPGCFQRKDISLIYDLDKEEEIFNEYELGLEGLAYLSPLLERL